MMKYALALAIALTPAFAFAQAVPTLTPRVTLAGPQGMNAAFATKADVASGTLKTPTVTGGTLDGLQTIPGAANNAAPRTFMQHFADNPNVVDYGAVGNGTTDDGPAVQAATSASPAVVFPHTTNGYVVNTGTYGGGTYPNANWAWPSNTGVYSPVGFWQLGNNRFQGSAIGDPSACTGNAFSPYTQPCLAVTDYKIIMDPASVWQGSNATNIGMDIECLPNHKNLNGNDTSNGYFRNWTACMYLAVDTGQDGQQNSSGSGFGSSISTEILNKALNIHRNSGIGSEDDVNVIDAVQDGGITRDYFILSSAAGLGQSSILAGHSPWGISSEWASAIDINTTPFTSTTKPATQTNGKGETVYSSSTSGSTTTYTIYPRWTRGVSSEGAVDDFYAGQKVAGESGNYFNATDSTGGTVFQIQKSTGMVLFNVPSGATSAHFQMGYNGNYMSSFGVTTTQPFYVYDNVSNSNLITTDESGNSSFGEGGSKVTTINGIMKLPGVAFSALPACGSSNGGLVAQVNNSTTDTWGATVSGGGSNVVVAFCDGANWTVMAK